DGNIVVSGSFEGTVDFDPGPGVLEYTSDTKSSSFLMKLSPAGDLIWAKAFINPDGDLVIASTALDNTNNIYVGGLIYGTADSDPSSATFNLVSLGGSD